MAQIPHVQPGEIIRASLINALIDAANAGGGATVPTGVPVPDLFGKTAGQARTTLMQPSVNLAMGTTIDTTGVIVDPTTADGGARVVINQSPSAGTYVPAGSPVNLVVAAAPSTGSTTPPPPTITRTEDIAHTATSTFRVGDTFVIVGTNFSPTASQNAVTFDGRAAASVAVDATDPTRRLVVVVPTGIPGAPVNPGDPDKAGVVVSVSVGGSTPATTTITVRAPSGVPQPTITNFTTPQFVGSAVTVNGTNFGPTAARNVVTLSGVGATVTSASATQIVFTVPNFSDLSSTSGSTKLVTITIVVKDGSGNTIGQVVSSTNLTVVRP